MSKKNDFDNFDVFAKDYRSLHGELTQSLGVESNYFADFKIKQLAREEQNNIGKPLRILDYGCGDGVAEAFFFNYFPHANITGVDVSEESIEIARKKGFQNTRFKVLTDGTIPLENETVDIVFIAMVMHHINHSLHASIFKELFRVLVPGGRIYIFEHNPFNPVTRHFVNKCVFDKDAHLLTPASLKNKLKLQGFNEVQNSYLFFFPRFKLLQPLLFIENHLRWFGLGGQYYTRGIKS